MAKRFSIIIPMRDAEHFIVKALESVSKQSFQDYECFVIDDHSADNSAPLVAEYIAKNPKNDIKLFSVPEGKWGAGAARNVGLRQAKGEYIVFLDSDDELNGLDALKHISGSIIKSPKTEVLLLGVKRIWWSGKGKRLLAYKTIPKPKHLNKHYQIGRNNEGAICFACWKRELFAKNDISFLENTFWEDLIPKLQLFNASNQDNINFCRHAVYVYNVRPGKSVGSNPTLAKAKTIISMHKEVAQLVKAGKVSPEYERDIRTRVRNAPLIILWMLGMRVYSTVFGLI